MNQDFQPVYRITPVITKALMSIEADRQVITDLPMTPGLLQSLRRTQKGSCHYLCGCQLQRLPLTY